MEEGVKWLFLVVRDEFWNIDRLDVIEDTCTLDGLLVCLGTGLAYHQS
jgi:hypothetical protein